MEVERINILGVPVDTFNAEDTENILLELLARPGAKQIVFLSIWGLLKARGKNNFAECVKSADLVIPVSKSILRGAAFLKKKVPVRHNQFKIIINILSVLDSHLKSLYILGGRKKVLQKAQGNVRRTFPNLNLVGRYVGHYPKKVEDSIIQAIYKASPSLVLVSEGVKEKDCWSYNRRNRFANSIFVYYKDVLGIFSEHIKRAKESTFEKGLEIWSEVFRNPLKIFLIFPYLYYIILLVWYRVFKK